MSFIFTLLGGELQARGIEQQAEARAQGFELQQTGVDFGLASFLQQLQATQIEQAGRTAATIQAANFNAAIAKENAAIAKEQARAEAIQVNRQNVLRLGSLRAAAGASGVSYEGSVTDVVGDIVTQGELARQNVLYLGELKARGENIDAHLESMRARAAYSAYNATSGMIGQQAALAMEAAEYEKYALRRRAQAERKGAKLGAAATRLGAIGDAFGQAQRMAAF